MNSEEKNTELYLKALNASTELEIILNDIFLDRTKSIGSRYLFEIKKNGEIVKITPFLDLNTSERIFPSYSFKDEVLKLEKSINKQISDFKTKNTDRVSYSDEKFELRFKLV